MKYRKNYELLEDFVVNCSSLVLLRKGDTGAASLSLES
jgi:hypothetical protein